MISSLRSVHVFVLALSLTGVRSDVAGFIDWRHLRHGGVEKKWSVGQAVETTSGIIIGHAAPVLTNVSEYLGIPYAKPPTGKLRFAKPHPFYGDKKINASSFVSFSLSIWVCSDYN
jgi:hypothetical protein